MIHPIPRASRLSLIACAILAAGLAGCATNNTAGTDKVKSLSQLPNKDQSMIKLGDTARTAGDCPAALRFYRLALEAGSENELLSVHIGIADCDVALGNVAEAQKEYTEAQKLAPDDPNPILGMGRIQLIAHNPTDALKLLDQAIAKGASGPWVWNDKGVALDQLRRHKEAQDAYRSGLSHYPNDRALRNNYALSLAMTANFAEAESILRPLAQDPDASVRTRLNLALVLGLKGNAAEAREVARNDLDGAALDNNARFYDYARATITGAPLPPLVPAVTAKPVANLDPELKASAERAALAASTPVPPESRALLAHNAAIKAAALAGKPAPMSSSPEASLPPVEQVDVAHIDPVPDPAPTEIEATAPPSPLVANSDGAADVTPVREARAKPVASTHTADAAPRAAGPVASSE